MSEEILNWKNTVLKNYKSKNSLAESEVNHILDWLNSDDANKYLNRLHRISVPQAIEHTNKWVERLNKKAQDVADIGGVEVVYSFDNGYSFVKILTKEAFAREGLLMGHCVSSYYSKKEIEIYSLRDSENNPHCTIELINSKKRIINQIKGKGNKEVVQKYHKFVIEFLKKSDIDIDLIEKYDISNIGSHCAGKNIFSFDKKTDLVLELDGNISWEKNLEYKKIRPHVLKVYGDFTIEGYETLSSYALFDEIHISGSLYVNDVDVLQRIANKVYVDGDVSISNCLELLKLGTEVYIGGSFSSEDSPELKCIGNTGSVNQDVTIIDCEEFNLKNGKMEIYGKVFIE